MQPLRIGLIGAGMAGRKHVAAARTIPDRAIVAAVCDPDAKAAQARAAEASVNAIYTDPHRMLREAAIDAVDVCATNDRHAELAIAAANAGKHILVEKPMATTPLDCITIIEAARKAGVVLMTAMNQRFKPNYLAAHAAIQRGDIGAIRAARFDALMDLLAFTPPGHWVYDGARAGGGVLMSYAPGRLDLMRFLLGDVARVFATVRQTCDRFINGAEDQAMLVLEFAGGAIGELFASFTPARLPDGESFTIIGDHVTIHAPGATVRSNQPLLVASGPKADFAPLPLDPASIGGDDGFAGAIAHFADCCRTGATPTCSSHDSLETMKLVFAAYASAGAGRAVGSLNFR